MENTMKIKIITDLQPFANNSKCYLGDIIEIEEADAKILISNKFAEKIEEKPKAKNEAPKRARNSKGQLIADDPSTPDINEAWKDGEAP
tara:strand:+ start:13646 stop:13912 length:267 start_codon:yes stop_codon:yes gene_type:complete